MTEPTGGVPLTKPGVDPAAAPATGPGSASPQYRVEHRKDPLPAGVWVVEHAKRYHALRVVGPGLIEIWDGRNQPRPIKVRRVKGGWWRRWRLRLVDEQGTKTVVRAIPFGEAGLADLGEKPTGGTGGGLLDGGDDIFGLILFLIWLIVVIVASPFAVRRRVRRNRVARAIRTAIAGQ